MAKEEVHRLSDMLVEEVSLVDRAANKRKFLLVKRDSTMGAGAQITAKPDGSYTATGGGGSAPAPNTNAPVPTPDAATRAKAEVALTEEIKATMSETLDGVIALLTEARGLVGTAKTVSGADDETMEPGALIDLVGDALGELDDAMMAAFGGEEEAPPPAEGEVPVAAAAPPLEKRLEVARAKRVIAKAEAATIGRDLVNKYGVRMKKERLARFQSAIDTLVSICSEVMAANLGKGKKPAPPPLPAPAEKTKTAKADALVDIAAHPAFVALQKQFKATAEKLATIEKSVAPSNAAPVNGSVPPSAADDVSWPMDMNDDRFRDKTDPNYFGR